MSTPFEPMDTSPPLDALLAEIESKNAQSDPSKVATPSPEEELAETPATSCIRFMVGDALLAAPLSGVQEVARMPKVTPLPGLPSWLEGITNIRGEVVSVVDMARFFGWNTTSSPKDSFMVLQNDHIKVGFRVHQLMGIVPLAVDHLHTPPGGFSLGDISQYLQGGTLVDDTFLYLISVDQLLDSPKMNAFQRAAL